MKIKNSIILFFLIFVSFNLSNMNADPWYEVKSVIDGDTIILQNGIHIRYVGIDTPELNYKTGYHEKFAYKAKLLNAELVLYKSVRLEFDKEKFDHYNRTLAYVFLKDGTFVNKEIIENGYAYTYYIKPNTKYYDTLLSAQKNAMSAQIGIWKRWKKKIEIYYGENKSKRFHRKSCFYGKQIKEKIIFNSMWDAYYSGFSPCGVCLK